MSAELLQRAAAVLREHAEKAQHTEPWCPEYTWSAVRHVQRNVDLDLDCVDHPDDESCPSFGRYDGKYVALMHPPVALALADVFDDLAEWGRKYHLSLDESPLLNVARAILREPEEASTDVSAVE